MRSNWRKSEVELLHHALANYEILEDAFRHVAEQTGRPIGAVRMRYYREKAQLNKHKPQTEPLTPQTTDMNAYADVIPAIEALIKENCELKTRILQLEQAARDYNELTSILDRARNLALQTVEVPTRQDFRMDKNGNLERITS